MQEETITEELTEKRGWEIVREEIYRALKEQASFALEARSGEEEARPLAVSPVVTLVLVALMV